MLPVPWPLQAPAKLIRDAIPLVAHWGLAAQWRSNTSLLLPASQRYRLPRLRHPHRIKAGTDAARLLGAELRLRGGEALSRPSPLRHRWCRAPSPVRGHQVLVEQQMALSLPAALSFNRVGSRKPRREVRRTMKKISCQAQRERGVCAISRGTRPNRCGRRHRSACMLRGESQSSHSSIDEDPLVNPLAHRVVP